MFDTEAAEVDEVARRDGISWGEALRRMAAHSRRHMPKGWHPGVEETT